MHIDSLKNYVVRNFIPKTFIKRLVKSSHAIIFFLSNKVIQVFFKDKTEVLFNVYENQITYLNNYEEIVTVNKNELSSSTDKELRKRVHYIKQTISSSKLVKPDNGNNEELD